MTIEGPAHQFVAFSLCVWTFAFQFYVKLLVVVPIHIHIAVHPLSVDNNVWSDNVAGLYFKYGCCLVKIGRTLDCRCNSCQFLSFALCSYNAHALWIVCGVIDFHVSSVCHVVVTLSLYSRSEAERHQCEKKCRLYFHKLCIRIL